MIYAHIVILIALFNIATPINVVQIATYDCGLYKFLINYDYDKVKNTAREPNMSLLNVYLYNGTQKEIYPFSSAGASSIRSSSLFDVNLPVVMFIHGYLADMNSPIVRGLVQAFLDKGGLNVLALDTLNLIQFDYLRAITNIRFIGEALGSFLANMISGGVPPSNIHLVGHSLGAHISGIAGKTLTGLTGFKIGRISGLEPAGPCFYKESNNIRLYKTDADFVDVIHSNSEVFGLGGSIGHVDFFPNGGKKQPEVWWQILGSHNMSWLYYASSIANPNGFVAVNCANIFDYIFNRCSNSPRAYMGYGASPSDVQGKYYLSTSARYPYYLGDAGTDPVKLFTAFIPFIG